MIGENNEEELLFPADLEEAGMVDTTAKYQLKNIVNSMQARLELYGTLGRREEFGRTLRGNINKDRFEEAFYDLDDNFIDDSVPVRLARVQRRVCRRKRKSRR